MPGISLGSWFLLSRHPAAVTIPVPTPERGLPCRAAETSTDGRLRSVRQATGVPGEDQGLEDSGGFQPWGLWFLKEVRST